LDQAGYAHRISPELGNVCFASASNGWIFSVPSFAKLYADYHGDSTLLCCYLAFKNLTRPISRAANFPAKAFAKRLWGNVYLHSDRSFKRKPEKR
jgi:U5 small nuclear ribonucleoprotein component